MNYYRAQVHPNYPVYAAGLVSTADPEVERRARELWATFPYLRDTISHSQRFVNIDQFECTAYYDHWGNIWIVNDQQQVVINFARNYQDRPHVGALMSYMYDCMSAIGYQPAETVREVKPFAADFYQQMDHVVTGEADMTFRNPKADAQHGQWAGRTGIIKVRRDVVVVMDCSEPVGEVWACTTLKAPLSIDDAQRMLISMGYVAS